MKGFLEEAVSFIKWFWTQIHRTDCGDSDHYPNGFLKLGCMEPVQIFKLAMSILCLILSLIYLYISKR